MIVVTGGAGFIGSVLARELYEQGHEDILVVDRVGKGPNLSNGRFQFLDADDFFETEKSFHSRITAIFHMGACSSTTEKNEDYLRKKESQI